ncbi:MAG: YraN family protein [Butyrivibrio sp.]|nr:YraN family protein [Butyrivibrio sp.]
MNKRNTGNKYEDMSCEYLEDNGLEIIERNFKCKIGEIDIIARDDKYTVFVEVKYRGSDQYGGALRAVDHRKQKKICKVSDYYRIIHKLDEYTPFRYDVLAVEGEGELLKFKWIKNAFDYTSGRRYI